MFDLEKAIAEWRTQMSASIKNSPTLDELENHLREETEKQKQSGANGPAAFDFAVHKIGQPGALKREFKKIGDRTLTADRVLGLLWFIYCAGSFCKMTGELSGGAIPLLKGGGFYLPDFRFNGLFFVAVFFDLIYLLGLIASLLLFSGKMLGRRFIFFLAILDAIGGVVVMFKSFQPLSCAFTILGFITIFAFWPRRKIESVAE